MKKIFLAVTGLLLAAGLAQATETRNICKAVKWNGEKVNFEVRTVWPESPARAYKQLTVPLYETFEVVYSGYVPDSDNTAKGTKVIVGRTADHMAELQFPHFSSPIVPVDGKIGTMKVGQVVMSPGGEMGKYELYDIISCTGSFP